MKNLKQLRKEHRLSMKTLGDKLGVSESTISLYENDKRQPDNEMLRKIANYFNCSVDFLLDRDNTNGQSYVPSIEQQRLLNNYASLNNKGKKKLLDYLDDLIRIDQYSDTVVIVEAARTVNNSDSIRVRRVKKEELEIFDTAPESDEKL